MRRWSELTPRRRNVIPAHLSWWKYRLGYGHSESKALVPSRPTGFESPSNDYRHNHGMYANLILVLQMAEGIPRLSFHAAIPTNVTLVRH